MESPISSRAIEDNRRLMDSHPSKVISGVMFGILGNDIFSLLFIFDQILLSYILFVQIHKKEVKTISKDFLNFVLS